MDCFAGLMCRSTRRHGFRQNLREDLPNPRAIGKFNFQSSSPRARASPGCEHLRYGSDLTGAEWALIEPFLRRRAHG
jgi:hypothetical protein